MRPYPVALQLYSVRDDAKVDFPGLLRKVARMGYAGVEFAGHHGLQPAELRRILNDLGLVACSCHGGIPTEADVAQTVETAKTLGYTHHISQFPGKEAQTRASCLCLIEKYKKGAALLEPHGITMGVHNHWSELDHEIDGKTPLEMLLDAAPLVVSQLDTYWAARAGKDPAQLIRRLAPRLPSLHIKDGPIDEKKPMLPIGDGRMVWGPVIDAADAAKSVKWLIVELDRVADNMLEAVEKSLRYLVDQGYGRGR